MSTSQILVRDVCFELRMENQLNAGKWAYHGHRLAIELFTWLSELICSGCSDYLAVLIIGKDAAD